MKKHEGFHGQKAVIIPRQVCQRACREQPVITAMYITDIGYYPNARHHFRERNRGADQHILIYCKEGQGKVRLHDTLYNIDPGECFLIPKNTPHAYGANEKTPWTIYWLHFTGTSADALVNGILQEDMLVKKFLHASHDLEKQFDDMYNRLERGLSTENLLHANLHLSAYLADCLLDNAAPTVAEENTGNAINAAIDFMHKRIHTKCQLHDLSAELNISISHLSVIFKQKTGYSPIEYFNHLKIQQASQFLLFTDLRVNEIAIRLGMEDPYYFSRFFKRHMGLSPQAYRARRKKDAG